VNAIALKYGLSGIEIHTAWMLRPYIEQRQIPNFLALLPDERRSAVRRARATNIHKIRKSKNPKALGQVKKNYRKTDDYIHLTFEQRADFIVEVAKVISEWDTAIIFAECIDKLHFDPTKTGKSIDEQAFEQLVSRFEQYIRRVGGNQTEGLLVHDNNESVEKKHADMMRAFHANGTLWTRMDKIIETPLFVDSKLTSMVQMADLCSFAIRRFIENGDSGLFDLIYTKADKVGSKVVGVRHFTKSSCKCRICVSHR